MKILRYPMKLTTEEQEVVLPRGARIMAMVVEKVSSAETVPVLYAKIDESQPKGVRKFWMCRTGETLKHLGSTYVGHAMIECEMWHVFEVN